MPFKTYSGWFLNLTSYLLPIEFAFIRRSIVNCFEQLIDLLSTPQLLVLERAKIRFRSQAKARYCKAKTE